MKRFFTFMLSLALALTLISCGSNDSSSTEKNSKADKSVTTTQSSESVEESKTQESSIVGTWKLVDGEEKYTFDADGTGTYEMVAGVTSDITYELTDTEITITYDEVSPTVRKYEIDGDSLKIQDATGGYKNFARE